MKEKKAQVVEAIKSALDAIFKAVKHIPILLIH
jgi:hypothetical protein